MFRVKICGVTNVEDAERAVGADADAIGVNFYEGSPRGVSKEVAAKIAAAAWVPWHAEAIGVFVNHSAEFIAEMLELDGMFGAQLHGDEPAEFVSRLSRVTSPEHARIVRVYRLGPDGLAAVKRDLTVCRAAGGRIDAVLVDAHRAGQYGGTGETVSWVGLADNKRWLGDTPLILAGGLTPDNVAEAIRIVRPAAVDVASGVESSPGKKDPAKVRDFVANALGAFEALGG
jgi:phosphoribosylanthranilate isomerase